MVVSAWQVKFGFLKLFWIFLEKYFQSAVFWIYRCRGYGWGYGWTTISFSKSLEKCWKFKQRDTLILREEYRLEVHIFVVWSYCCYTSVKSRWILFSRWFFLKVLEMWFALNKIYIHTPYLYVCRNVYKTHIWFVYNPYLYSIIDL